MRSDFYSLPYAAQQAIRRGERAEGAANNARARIAQLEADLKTSRDQTIFWEQKYTDDLAKAREERDEANATIRYIERQFADERGVMLDKQIALTAERDALRERMNDLIKPLWTFCHQFETGWASGSDASHEVIKKAARIAREALGRDWDHAWSEAMNDVVASGGIDLALAQDGEKG